MTGEQVTNPQVGYPRYRCHKEVWALKIEEVVRGPIELGATLVFVEKMYADRAVSDDYVRKHSPEAGGYLVIYADGYESFSPAEPFEDGYTRIEG